jgi:CBS-domain-containing membrane protein
MKRREPGEGREMLVAHAVRTSAFSSTARHAPVATLMNAAVASVGPEMCVDDLMTFFVHYSVHSAPVVDRDSKLLGFVSMSDLLVDRDQRGDSAEVALRVPMFGGGDYALGSGFHAQAFARTVNDIMSSPAIHVAASAPLTTAAALMAFEGVQHIPVVDESHRLVGMISTLDMMRWLARQDGFCVPDYTQRKRTRPWA